MDGQTAPEQTAKLVEPAALSELIEALRLREYDVIGPTVHDGAITYDTVVSVDDLPIGWTDEQRPGGYALTRRDDAALFGYVLGQRSWKHYLYPPRSALVHIKKAEGGSLVFSEPVSRNRRFAFLGVRACEMAAIAIQDTVFLGSEHTDRTYATQRTDAFFVGVNCAVVGTNCFCASMGTGPSHTAGYDLVITEIIDGDRHELLCVAGSARGAEVLADVSGRTAGSSDLAAAGDIMERSAASITKRLDTDGLHELLASRHADPHWDDVASRCLACTNCTLVCPTCFCSTTEDTATLDGSEATRSRRWDSCFALDFSALHGTPVRTTTAARYRQWFTHKLSSWYDQFDSSGCVGCGRCITWCPVGIDITAEAAAIRKASEVPA